MPDYTRHPRLYFDRANVVFLVENTLFRVYGSFIPQSILDAAARPINILERLNDDEAIVLPGIDPEAFANLLRIVPVLRWNAIPDGSHIHPHNFDCEGWLGVLELCDRFYLNIIDQLAMEMQQLTFTDLDIITNYLAICSKYPASFPRAYIEGLFFDMCNRSIGLLSRKQKRFLGPELSSAILRCRAALGDLDDDSEEGRRECAKNFFEDAFPLGN